MMKIKSKTSGKFVPYAVAATGGLLYLKVWLPLTDIGIPCVFHELTGAYCPGCGITRSLASILQGDVYQAFRFNALVFIIAPLYLLYMYTYKRQYIKFSKSLMSVILIITILFGILRNFPMFSLWTPPES